MRYLIAVLICTTTAATAEEIHPYIRKQLEQYAAHCVVASDGSIWSFELTERAKRLGGLDAEPFTQQDAPLYYDIKSGEAARNSDQALLRIRQRLGHRLIHTKILGVHPTGVRVRSGDQDLLIIRDTDGLAEGDTVAHYCLPAGTHEYVTVLGTSRTIPQYEPAPAVSFQPADWQTLGRYLVEHEIDGLPKHRYRKSPQSHGRVVTRDVIIEAPPAGWEFELRVHRLQLPENWPTE